MSQPIGWANFGVPMIHGEGGVPSYDPNWLTCLDNLYAYMQSENAFSLYWAAGSAWGQGYPLYAGPKTVFLGVTLPNSGTRDPGVMAVITKYTGAAQPTGYYWGGPTQGPSGSSSGLMYAQYMGYSSTSIPYTPSCSHGVFSPSSSVFPAHTFNPFTAFTLTPTSTGSLTCSISAGGALTDPPPLSYLSLSTASLSAYELMPGPIVFAWAPFKLISTYSSTGSCVAIMRASDSTTQTFSFSGGVLNQSAITTFLSGTTGQVTELFDQSGAGNNATIYIDTAHGPQRPGPTPIVNGQNSLLTLQFSSGPPDTALASSASVNGGSGVSAFIVAKPNSATESDILSFIGNWTYPSVNTVGNPNTNITIPCGLTDTTSYHSDAVVLQQGDFPDFTTTYVDGAQIATMPGCDNTLQISSTLDLGFFRYFQPASYQGYLGQIVLIGSAVSSGDVTRAHTLDKANWNTP